MPSKNSVFKYYLSRIQYFCNNCLEMIIISYLIKALYIIKCSREHNPIMIAIFTLTNTSMITLLTAIISYPINVSY